MDKRSSEELNIEIDGETYEIEVVEIPFREGVELRCEINDELLRVSDRGLGLHEAKRLMEEEIKRFLKSL